MTVASNNNDADPMFFWAFLGLIMVLVLLTVGSIIGERKSANSHTRECVELLVELDDIPDLIAKHCTGE